MLCDGEPQRQTLVTGLQLRSTTGERAADARGVIVPISDVARRLELSGTVVEKTMTKDAEFKRLIRARMDKTGESYAAARSALMDSGDVSPTKSSGFAPDPDGEAVRAARARMEGLLNRIDSMHVDVDAHTLRVAYADPAVFEVQIPRNAIRGAERVPNSPATRSLGVHGWRGKWLVNSAYTNLVRVTVDPAVRANLDPGAITANLPNQSKTLPLLVRVLMRERRPRIKELTISVEDPEAFLAAIGQ